MGQRFVRLAWIDPLRIAKMQATAVGLEPAFRCYTALSPSLALAWSSLPNV